VRIVGEVVGQQGTTVGRADVAGRLGPQYAVAFGLAVESAGLRSPI
jgi:hypothetical protein